MSFPFRSLVRLLLETHLSYDAIGKELRLSPELVRSYDLRLAKLAPSDPSYLLNVSDATLRRRLSKASDARRAA